MSQFFVHQRESHPHHLNNPWADTSMPGKESRKRRRLAKTGGEERPVVAYGDRAIPLGEAQELGLDGDSDKDDEERALESSLFGKTFVPRTDKRKLRDRSEELEDEEAAGRLDHVEDQDVSPQPSVDSQDI